MKLLYLTEDYHHSRVHNNLLIQMLDEFQDLKIFVFSPTRPRVGKTISSSFGNHDRLIIVTPSIDIPTNLYRFDFWAKIRCKVRLIEQCIPIKDIDAIHAATLFTEGCTARYLNKKYCIPYLVSMRGSDSDFYARYMLHLWPMSFKTIKLANAVTFVTPAIKSKMLNKSQYKRLRNVLENGEIINNGVDSIWLENLNLGLKPIGSPVRILYIGRFDSNKNVMKLIEAVKEIRMKQDIQLTVIGGDGDHQAKIEYEISKHPEFLSYLGKIYDKHQLMNVIRQHDIFAMVSHSETFGLVYVECLSQGLPVVYSLGTGFDGMYPEGLVGYGAYPDNINSIADAIEKCIKNYDSLALNISKLDLSIYYWSNIAKKYVSMYQSILNS